MIDYGENKEQSHNPYFNRWFSAIQEGDRDWELYEKSQSLF